MSEKMFPLQSQRDCPAGPREIPWSVAEKAHGEYARQCGYGCQTLERLAERGGFGWGEMDGLYPAWREETSFIIQLQKENNVLRNALIMLLQKTTLMNIDEWIEACDFLNNGVSHGN